MLRTVLILPALVLLLTSLVACAASGPTATARLEPTGKPLVYVALGASDAVGVGAGGPNQSWVDDLYRKLPAGSRLVNLGISGEKLRGALTDELPVAVDAHPDLVTIWLAVNDINARVSATSYEQDLDRMLTTLHDQTHAHIVIGNVPDLSLVPIYSSIDKAAVKQAVDQWNAIIARQAAEHGATVVDLHANWQDLASHPEYVGIDGFHPSAAGYQRLADLFFSSMQARGLV